MPEVRRGVRGLLAGLVAAPLLLTACSPQDADEPSKQGQTGIVAVNRSVTQVTPADRQAAPVLSGRRLGEQTSVSTADYRGKVVVVNVWGSWCAPCRAEAPDLQKASVQAAKKAQFVGLDTKDPAEAAAVAFVRAQEITYPSIYDPNGSELVKLSGNLPLSAIPSTLVIDPEGRVAARIIGPISTRSLVDLIDDVAAGK